MNCSVTFGNLHLLQIKPQPGDLIEIFRGSYQHWAVYIGDGFVVHLAPPSENPGAGAYSMMSIVCDRALVARAGFWEVVGTDEWRINNILDDQCEPRRADLVVQEARRLVGAELPYSVFQSNCEHFATELRYGKAQVRLLVKSNSPAGERKYNHAALKNMSIFLSRKRGPGLQYRVAE
uniref:LRAT domain-containing protein n=1 Tax=Gadus morhua TaxID=8049 RepID=A0A8C5CHU0_GADMO